MPCLWTTCHGFTGLEGHTKIPSGLMSATGVWNKRSKQDKNGTMKLKIFFSVSIKEVHDAISVSHQKLGHGNSLGMSCKPHCSIGK